MFKTTHNIALTGVLVALTIIFGVFLHFPLGGANISLIIIPIALLPLFLPFWYAVLGASLSVSLVDVITGWGAFAWISALTYTTFIFCYYYFAKKLWLGKMMLLGSMLVLLTFYVFLDWCVFGASFALSDLIATSIQLSISYAVLWPLTWLITVNKYFKLYFA